MRSSNPVFSSLTESQRAQGQNPYGGYDQFGGQYQTDYNAPQQTERPMTVDDVITKTGITLGVIVAFALLNFGIMMFVSPGLAMILTIVGAIGGFITVLVGTFGKKYGSAAVTLIYAAFEGLFVGGISLLFSGFLQGYDGAGAMIGQAVVGTLGVFLGMLFVYKTGAIKVTPKFNRIITSMMIGVLVLVLGNLVMALFGFGSPLRDGGILAIVFSLFCIGLAAFSFLTDFDAADRMVREGVPAKMAWGVALGLAVTLVWLYTEILRLLSYFRGD